mgnify:FL=1
MNLNRTYMLPALLTLTLTLGACSRAQSNVKTLNTTDCGKTWTVIPTGSRIPTNTTNYCGYNITLPDHPIQGGTELLTQFQKQRISAREDRL